MQKDSQKYRKPPENVTKISIHDKQISYFYTCAYKL